MEQQHRVLVVLAHPALEKSRVNAAMAKAALEVPGVTVHDLYQTYPNFFINKAHEQELVKAHKVIVFQHPLYWYSVPALLKEWMDIVFEYGFAYGRGSKGLIGQVLMNAWSAGSPHAELAGDANTDLIAQLMRPFEHTAQYCGMRYLPPHTLFNTGMLTPAQIADACSRYVDLLERLTTAAFLERNLESFACLGDALEADAHG